MASNPKNPTIKEPNNHLADIRQSRFWANYLEELGWKATEISPGYYVYLRKIPLLGTIAKIPRANLPIPFKKIDKLAESNNIFLAKLEPRIETTHKNVASLLSLLKTNGFVTEKWALLPTRTISVDLTKSEDELLKSMEKDTRYSVRLAVRRGVRVKETNDFDQFKLLYFDTAKRKGFWPAKKEVETLWKVFSKEGSAAILTAFYQRKPLASTLVLFHGKIGNYQHAASADTHREVMASYLLLWEAMRFLKKKGCTKLDLEGVTDPRIKATKKWAGFTLFKRGFGGKEIEYLGSFAKYYKLWSKILFLPTRFF